MLGCGWVYSYYYDTLIRLEMIYIREYFRGRMRGELITSGMRFTKTLSSAPQKGLFIPGTHEREGARRHDTFTKYMYQWHTYRVGGGS